MSLQYPTHRKPNSSSQKPSPCSPPYSAFGCSWLILRCCVGWWLWRFGCSQDVIEWVKMPAQKRFFTLLIWWWLWQFHQGGHYATIAPFCGSHSLSVRRTQRTKSSRPEGPTAGPKDRKLEVANLADEIFGWLWHVTPQKTTKEAHCNIFFFWIGLGSTSLHCLLLKSHSDSPVNLSHGT